MKKKILIIFFLFFSSEKLASEINNSVIITVGNNPITRLDLIKEIKLLSVLSRTAINENNREELKSIAIQTLIKRTIKKSEIERLKINKYNPKDLEKQISKIANNLGLDNQGLKIFLGQNNLKYEDVVKNFEIDLKWNTAIFRLYKNKVSLNTFEIEDKINTELEKLKPKRSLLLSEIQVNVSTDGIETTSNKVLSKINQEGFENVARNLSISSSAKDGGNLGWIDENKLSRKIYDNIKGLKNGEISKPISLGEIIIFIKKNDEKSISSDLETIKKNIVNQEKMKKLEMFSNSHYSDLEKRIKVRFL